jgi:hypothetical protein
MQLSITCVIRLRTTNLFRCNPKHVLWLDFQTFQTSLALMWICLSVHLAHVYRGIYIYVWVDIHVDYTGTCIYTYTLMLSFEQLQFSLNKFFEARVSSRFKFSSHLCTEAQPLKSSLQLSCGTASFFIPQHVLPCKCTKPVSVLVRNSITPAIFVLIVSSSGLFSRSGDSNHSISMRFDVMSISLPSRPWRDDVGWTDFAPLDKRRAQPAIVHALTDGLPLRVVRSCCIAKQNK